MIVSNNKRWATCVALIAGAVAQASAADFTWNGGAGNGNWSSDANWQGGAAPSGAGHTLYFSGTNGLNTLNNTLTSVSGIVFTQGAGAFILGQNSLSLGGNIVNSSTNTQTITLPLALTTHRSVDTRNGDVILQGAVSASGVSFRLDKLGRETLEMQGANTFQGRSHVYRGTYRLDASTGSIASTDIYFGDPLNGLLPNNATFAVKGANYTFGGTLAVVNNAANTVRAEGVAFIFNSYSLTGASFFGTMNFDISQAGSSVAVKTAPTLTNGQLLFTTVTDGVKTGFAQMSGSNIVRRDSAALAALPASSSTATDSYRAGGATVMSASQSVHTLTLTGSGSLTGAAHALTVREVLMEEGIGDYRMSVARVGHNSNMTFHQYSQSGTLIIDSQILLANTNNSINKTGPGTMRITDSSISSYLGGTRVQSGRLELDGELTRTASVTVFDNATLAGGGRIGATTASAVEIRGGHLAGTTSRALRINGTLAFTQEGEFAMQLDGEGTKFVDVSGAITLGSDINLSLTLESVPVLNSEIILLRGSSITGNFATVNEMQFGQDGQFDLLFNSNTYSFELYQTGTEIGLRAIPEPSMLALLGIGAAFVLARRHRR